MSPVDTMSPVLWLLMSQNPPFVWSFTSRCTHTFLTEGEQQTVRSAGITCGNHFSEQLPDQKGSIPLTLFESKAGCGGPVQLRFSLTIQMRPHIQP